MALLSALIDEIVPKTQDCFDTARLNALRKSANILLTKTKFMLNDLPQITTQAGVGTYQLTPLAGTLIVELDAVVIASRELKAISKSELEALNVNWRNTTGLPKCYVMDSPTMLRLYPAPASVVDVNVRVAATVAMDSEVIDDDVFNDLHHAIVDGALAELLMTPNKPWTNFELAAFYDGRFKKAITTARVDKAKRFSKAPLRTKAYS